MGALEPNPAPGTWFLEGYLDGGKRLWKVPIRKSPFRVGRRPNLDLSLPSSSVSQEHAELRGIGEELRIRDLGSTNGTFVNRQRIVAEAALQDGDIIHFAMVEFRVGRENRFNWASATNTARLEEDDLPRQLVAGTRQFQQMLREERVTPLFQPICRLADAGLHGYELLGRGNSDELPRTPAELFRIAASLGLEGELSRVFRKIGIDVARGLTGRPNLFVNTHPVENQPKLLIEELRLFRQMAPDLPIVLEIHEAAVTDVGAMRDLKGALRDLGVALAYDDFGAGQARLLELVEAPPDILKFDMGLVRGIDKAPPQKQQVLETLVRMSVDLGIENLAEGVETAAEADICRQMGFVYAQGYLYGRPLPASEL